MEIPLPKAGKVRSLKVKEGDVVSEGDALLELEVAKTSDLQTDVVTEGEALAPVINDVINEVVEPSVATSSNEELLFIPDLGGSHDVDVIEISAEVGVDLTEGDCLVVLETDKASMEIPVTKAGKLLELKVAVGDKVSAGDPMAVLAVSSATASAEPSVVVPAVPVSKQETVAPEAPVSTDVDVPSDSNKEAVYAGPAVRKLARQLGVNLNEVEASGPRGRLTKDDVRLFVKNLVQHASKTAGTSVTGIPPIPDVDFAKFGDVELQKMSKIKKITVANMSRSWLNVPHVTHFDESDISDMESFRHSMKSEAENRGVKLTPLPFLLKAVASALQFESSFNVSLHSDGEHIVQKKYIHIGVAVDTPAGLLVPVIRDVDKKGLWELAEETTLMARKARDGKLTPGEMQGACFTVSSLGAMGGIGFTPIVNAPEVGILGVSKSQIKPSWNGAEFVPKNTLPLSLSYDHRAVNGVNAGRFMTHLVGVLNDIRRLSL